MLNTLYPYTSYFVRGNPKGSACAYAQALPYAKYPLPLYPFYFVKGVSHKVVLVLTHKPYRCGGIHNIINIYQHDPNRLTPH